MMGVAVPLLALAILNIFGALMFFVDEGLAVHKIQMHHGMRVSPWPGFAFFCLGMLALLKSKELKKKGDEPATGERPKTT